MAALEVWVLAGLAEPGQLPGAGLFWRQWSISNWPEWPIVVHLQQIGTKDRSANSLIFAMQHGFVTNHIAFVAIPGR